MTEITTMSTITPSMTPTIEMSVMIETKVRFGFRYRSARKKLNGSFKVPYGGCDLETFPA
jgi:transcription initiation factor TFIID subunit TAF12